MSLEAGRSPFDPVRLRHALHPLSEPPSGEPFNRDDVRGLLAEGFVPREAAVLVGIVPREDAERIVLTLRTDGLRHHAGQVSFPGGRVEDGDAGPVGAARREAWEEIGLSEAAVEPLGYLDPLLTITGFRVTPVVARIDPGFRPRPDPREVAEVFEVPFVDLLRPVNLERRELRVAGRPRSVYEYIGPGAGGRRIWGATASILHNFALRLEHARLEQA
jgi:8-oxo-dGTP pyrophosphatase MutT (NUDIX family)